MFDQREYPKLPSLDPGVTLLDADDRATGALQSLVLDHVLLGDGPAVWADSRGNATTEPFARLAPSRRVLDRVRVARAFTPWQHHGLLRALDDEVTDDTALVVLPDVDTFYRVNDLRRTEGDRLFAAGVDLVADLAARHDVPVLVTRHRDDALARPVAEVADDVVDCELTPLGPRFAGEAFETLVYPVEGDLVQTTFAFWRRVLADRHPAAASAAPASDAGTEPRGVSVRGSY